MSRIINFIPTLDQLFPCSLVEKRKQYIYMISFTKCIAFIKHLQHFSINHFSHSYTLILKWNPYFTHWNTDCPFFFFLVKKILDLNISHLSINFCGSYFNHIQYILNWTVNENKWVLSCPIVFEIRMVNCSQYLA